MFSDDLIVAFLQWSELYACISILDIIVGVIKLFNFINLLQILGQQYALENCIKLLIF